MRCVTGTRRFSSLPESAAFYCAVSRCCPRPAMTVDKTSHLCSTSHGLPRHVGWTVLRTWRARPWLGEAGLVAALRGQATTRCICRKRHSHSIVDGGFDEMSSATRLTAGISLMIRLEIFSSKS